MFKYFSVTFVNDCSQQLENLMMLINEEPSPGHRANKSISASNFSHKFQLTLKMLLYFYKECVS